MANELWTKPITRSTDWGGDESTDHLPVAGSVVQGFIKSELNEKVGYIYHDKLNSKYLCFSNVDTYEEYIKDPSRTDLILSSLTAPSDFVAEIIMKSPIYNAVLLGQTGTYLEFGFNIKSSGDQSYADNVSYTITFTRNASKQSVSGILLNGKTLSLNIDNYLTQEGLTTVTINITGQSTSAVASTSVTYEVVSLVLTNDYDVSQTYDLTDEIVPSLSIRYSLLGTSNIKYLDWYLDGEDIGTDEIIGGTVEAITQTKTIVISGLSHGVHNVQFRAHIKSSNSGEEFYTDTFYREFIVISDKQNSTPLLATETIVPSEVGIIPTASFYGLTQYEPYTIYYGVYNPKNLASTEVEIYLDEELAQTVNAPNGKELSYSFIPDLPGSKSIKFKVGNSVREFSSVVEETSLDINEIAGEDLILNLIATGRSNSDADRDSWIYGDYTTSFKGFTWSEISGWNDDRLVIGEGMSVSISGGSTGILKDNSRGKTIELEYETINVIDDNTVICNLTNSSGLGLLMTASEASLRVGTAEGQVVSTKFKSNENIRVSFVLDTSKRLALIYIDGIMTGAINMGATIFSINEDLIFTGSSTAGIKLKQVRVYNTPLTSEQILNNYILYRDTITEMTSVYERNDILEGSQFSFEKLAKFLPVMKITGDVAWLETQKDTDAQKPVYVEYTDPKDPTRNFTMGIESDFLPGATPSYQSAILRIQGTSSAGYPKKNYRLYTKRGDYKAKVVGSEGVVVKELYSFKDRAVPVKCWCLKADYAESSGTHNTGVATMWNSVMYNVADNLCKTQAQIAAIENNYEYDVRTTVDGFPIVVFARPDSDPNTKYTFIGKYNFNNDKSTENVFGFCDIPGFDDAYVPGHEDQKIPAGEMNAGKEYTYGNKMQCWELTENGNNYAVFQTTTDWNTQIIDEKTGLPKYEIIKNDDGSETKIPINKWTSGFEARYPDDGNEADTSDLLRFANWVVGCAKNPKINYIYEVVAEKIKYVDDQTTPIPSGGSVDEEGYIIDENGGYVVKKITTAIPISITVPILNDSGEFTYKVDSETGEITNEIVTEIIEYTGVVDVNSAIHDALGDSVKYQKYSIDKDFSKTWKDHIDTWKMAAYYVYLLRFGAVDQVVKNSMFTSEDGQHWYFINYDNDTILGLKNTGALVYPPDITRETKDGSTYAYAGHESNLWNQLEQTEEFMSYVTQVDTKLYDAGLTYENAIKYFNTNQSDKWCQRIYNKDAEYKYLSVSSEEGSDDNTLFMLQGSRKAHRTWWLSKRFKLMDGKFSNSNYVNTYVMIKLAGSPGMSATITAGDYMYYGCQSNQVDIQMGVELNYGESYEFKKAPASEPGGKDFAVGDPIYIYAPYAIESLDISKITPYLEEITFKGVKDPVLGTRLRTLIMSSNKTSDQSVKKIAGLEQAENLETLDIRGLRIGTDTGSIDLTKFTLLKNLYMKGSTQNSLVFADGCGIKNLELTDNLETIIFNNLPDLKMDYVTSDLSSSTTSGFNRYIPHIEINNCPGLVNFFQSDITIDKDPENPKSYAGPDNSPTYFRNWALNAKKDYSLKLSGINWEGVNPEWLLDFQNILDVGATFSLKGKVVLSSLNEDQVAELKKIFGDGCFTNDAEFWITTPESVFVEGPKEFRSGDTVEYTTEIFSSKPGEVVWSVIEGGQWIKDVEVNGKIVKIVPNKEKNSGTLTTIEDTTADHQIVIQASHFPKNYDSSVDTVSNRLYTITSKKIVYTTGGNIEGDNLIKEGYKVYTLELDPETQWRGNYEVEWSLEEILTDDSSSLDSSVVPIVITEQDSSTKETSEKYEIPIGVDYCKVDYVATTVFQRFNLIATIKNITHDNEVVGTISVTKEIVATDKSILLTKLSNPEVMRICYEQGWSSNDKIPEEYPESKIDPENVMYIWQAQMVTDIGNAFQGGQEGYNGPMRPGSFIKTFNELASFKIIHLDNNAFNLCSQLTEITLPSTLESIGSLAFSYTGLTKISIPQNVRSINSTAFFSVPSLEEFITNEFSDYFSSINGVLFNKDKTTLVKYPEGKVGATYEVPDTVITLNSGAFRSTQYLEQLTLSDSVIYHGSDSMKGNKVLNKITLGASITPTNLAEHIGENPKLINLEIHGHSSLISDDGAIYDSVSLIKYPEGRDYLTINRDITNIGTYSLGSVPTGVPKFNVAIPDSVTTIESQAFFNNNAIEILEFSASSRLHTLKDNSLQLMQAVKRVILPPSLKYIGSAAFSSNPYLGDIEFLRSDSGSIAPEFTDITITNPITTAFGSWSKVTWSDTATYPEGYTKSPDGYVLDNTGNYIYTSSNATGSLVDKSQRYLRFPSNAEGFEDEEWKDSILNPYRNAFNVTQSS